MSFGDRRMEKAGVGCMAVCIVSVGVMINTIVPYPYMDEIFHVAQTAEYCNGHYASWDPMITTLPGTYVHGLIWSKGLGLIVGDKACTAPYLRSLNWLFGGLLGVLCYKLFRELHPAADVTTRMSYVSAAVLCPPLVFVTFLYYTDTVATFYALLCIYLALKAVPTPGHVPEAPRLSAVIGASLAGAMAVFCRQTNIVWVAFAGATAAIRLLGQRKASYDDYVDQYTASGYSLVALPWPTFAVKHFRVVLRFLWPLALVGVGFVVFYLYNGGIVVGDRESHAPALNVGQFGYMLLWAALPLALDALNPSTWRRGIDDALPSLRSALIGVVVLGVACVAMALGLKHYSPVHLYTLSDNRHYTFYLWSRFLSRGEHFRMAMAVPYVCSAAIIAHRLWRSVGASTTCLWFLVAAAVTLPASLFEFRYYIAPSLVAHLFISYVPSRPATRSIRVYLTAVSLLNAATLYVFMYKPYHTSDGLARFMW